jgi:glyoxylase-like metal-dependent hydrolase (beta-lactamase superfamily II)
VAEPAVRIGDFEVTLIRHSVYWWDGGALFGVVPKTLWSRKTPGDELNRVEMGFNCYLIRAGGKTILIETGLGDKRDALSRERMRVPAVTEPLASLIDPDSVDIVVNSHLHWDHCSGNTVMRNGRAEPAFPRAQYFASRGEWEHAHERLIRDRISYLDENYDSLVESGQMILVAGDFEVVPGVSMRLAPGHTRDMMVVTAESRGETFCFLSDLVPTGAHVQPSWVAAFDLYPLQTIETKQEWLAKAAGQNWICAFAHEPSAGFARIVPDPKSQFGWREL